MPDADRIQCVRCGQEGDALASPPFRDELGRRVQEEICRNCWEDWKERQMLLINHYGLSLREADARSFLLDNLRGFLFDEGEGEAEIDTTMEGEVDW